MLVTALAALALCGAAQHDLALLSARTGQVQRWVTSVREAGSVRSDSRGGWYVTGRAGGCPAPYSLWHLRGDGSLDPDWRPVQNVVPQLVAGGTLYVTAHYFVAALDARTGAVRWKTPIFDASSLALGFGRLYVGGGRRVLALDPRSGRRLAWHGPTFAPHSSVYGVAVIGPRLFVGGSPSLLAYDARTGTRLHWHASPTIGDVEHVFAWRSRLFTAGHDGFGITDAATGRVDPWLARVRGYATQFAGSGSVVYLGGEIRNSFDAVDEQPRHDLAAIDVATGRLLPWAPMLARYVAVGSIAANEHSVLVAGSFMRSLG